MDEIAPEYDVVVCGTGQSTCLQSTKGNPARLTFHTGLTECVLSGYATTELYATNP